MHEISYLHFSSSFSQQFEFSTDEENDDDEEDDDDDDDEDELY